MTPATMPAWLPVLRGSGTSAPAVILFLPRERPLSACLFRSARPPLPGEARSVAARQGAVVGRCVVVGRAGGRAGGAGKSASGAAEVV